MFETEDGWRAALKALPVRIQWNPDRVLTGVKLERHAIQIGLAARSVHDYVYKWIIENGIIVG